MLVFESSTILLLFMAVYDVHVCEPHRNVLKSKTAG